jgi:hypothetical protein
VSETPEREMKRLAAAMEATREEADELEACCCLREAAHSSTKSNAGRKVWRDREACAVAKIAAAEAEAAYWRAVAADAAYWLALEADATKKTKKKGGTP